MLVYCGTIYVVKQWFFLWVFLLIVFMAYDNLYQSDDNSGSPPIENTVVRGVLHAPENTTTWVVYGPRHQIFTIPADSIDARDNPMNTSNVEVRGDAELYADSWRTGAFVGVVDIRLLRYDDLPPRV